MNFMYKLFSKYFSEYKNNVARKLGSLIRVSDEEVLSVCLEELNMILEIIAGRVTSKLDLPQYNKFPNSTEFNTLLQHIDIDLDKLFQGAKLIINDAQNVVNYNSTEREAITELLSQTQAQVYSAYISSKKGISGTTIIKETFNAIDDDQVDALLGVNSSNVGINTSLKRLSVKEITANISKDNKSLNVNGIDAYHFDEQPLEYNIYPNEVDLRLGSYWNTAKNEHHFERKSDPSYEYRSGFTKTGNESTSNIASCQFESVLTVDTHLNNAATYTSKIHPLEQRIEHRYSEEQSIPINYIFVDRPNSLNGKYISNTYDTDKLKANIKLKIPFVNANLATGITLELNPNDGNVFPSINGAESFVRSDVIIDDLNGSNKVGVTVISKATIEENGEVNPMFTVMFDRPVVPTMVELEFNYLDSAGWPEIAYAMRAWSADISKQVHVVTQVEGEAEKYKEITYKRILFLLVDDEDRFSKSSELNKIKELYSKTNGVK